MGDWRTKAAADLRALAGRIEAGECHGVAWTVADEHEDDAEEERHGLLADPAEEPLEWLLAALDAERCTENTEAEGHCAIWAYEVQGRSVIYSVDVDPGPWTPGERASWDCPGTAGHFEHWKVSGGMVQIDEAPPRRLGLDEGCLPDGLLDECLEWAGEGR